MSLAKVVNIKTGAQYDVYIGRAGKGQTGRWGNPYRLDGQTTRDQVIERYRQWLRAQIRIGAITLDELAGLHGKILGCFCKPAACHGDVLARAAAWAHEQLEAR